MLFEHGYCTFEMEMADLQWYEEAIELLTLCDTVFISMSDYNAKWFGIWMNIETIPTKLMPLIVFVLVGCIIYLIFFMKYEW